MYTLLQILAAAVLLAVPGFAAVAAMRRGTSWRDDPAGAIALLFTGVGLSSIALWLVTSWFGLTIVTALATPLAVAAGVLLAGRQATRGSEPLPDRAESIAHAKILGVVAIVSVGLVIVPFAPFGWEAADGVHRMSMTDWEKHLVMAGGIAASRDFPPPHPYLQAARPSYYFGFHLLAAALKTGSGGADTYHMLLLLTLLTTAATPFVAYVFARDLAPPRAALAGAAAGALLLGFDAVVMVLETLREVSLAWPLPSGFDGLRAAVPSFNIDFWIHNWERQFNAPLATVIWSPHQVTGALTALMAVHLVHRGQRRLGTALIAGMLLASVLAMSAYVAVGLALGLGVAALDQAISRRCAPWSTDVFRNWIGPAAIAAPLVLPVIPVLTAGDSSGLVLHVSDAGRWTNGALFTFFWGPGQLTGLLDSPAIYLFEFGAIGALGSLEIARRWRDGTLTTQQRAIATATLALLAILAVVRPPVGIGNNLYARALLIAWFGFLPFAGMAALRCSRRALAIVVAIGLAGSAYLVAGNLAEGAVFWATAPSNVTAFEWVNANTPPRARVAVADAEMRHTAGYWLRRPLVLGQRRLALLFGASPEQYAAVENGLEAAMTSGSSNAAARLLREIGADVLMLSPATPAAQREQTLNWAQPPCFVVAETGGDWLIVVPAEPRCGAAPD